MSRSTKHKQRRLRRSWWLVAFVRGIALFLGLYVALSLIALVRGGAHNLNSWWIDLSIMPGVLAVLLQAIVAAVLLAFAFRVPRRALLRRLGALVCVFFALCAFGNALEVWLLAASGVLGLGFPLPFSLIMTFVFLILAVALLRGYRSLMPAQTRSSRGTSPAKQGAVEQNRETDVLSSATLAASETRPWLSGVARAKTVSCMTLALLLSGFCFPLTQVLCFGLTDYRTRVDAIVVFGAQVMDDGRLSTALRTRVDAAIALYEEGRAPILIMSGGTGINDVNEAESMAQYAIDHGVPESALLLDRGGNNTELSVEHSLALAEEHGLRRLGATSSFYHLARIKMLFLLHGHDVTTSPAPLNPEDTSLTITTFREIPGWWYYWFAGLLK